MEIEFDPAKHAANLAKRGFGFELAARIFAGRTIEADVTREGDGETRILATGAVESRVLAVVYTMRGPVRRIISARIASRKERERYEAD